MALMVGAELEHLAVARYLGGGAMRGIAGGVLALSRQIDRMRQSSSAQSTLPERMKAGADAAARVASNQQPPAPTVNSYGVQSSRTLNGGTKPTTKI